MSGQLVGVGQPGPVTLSELDEAARYERFDRLQSRMGRVWDSMKLNLAGESVVVIPSVSLDRAVANPGSLNQAYEERYLFLLLLLRQPRLRMIYVTSMPVAPSIVEYYLALLAGVIPSHARSRLSLVSVGDSSPASLSEKLLARPKLLASIAGAIPTRRCRTSSRTTRPNSSATSPWPWGSRCTALTPDSRSWVARRDVADSLPTPA